MNRFYCVLTKSYGVILLVGAFATAGLAAEQAGPELKNALYFGGSGDQGAAQGSMGMAIHRNRLYLSGNDRVVGGEGLALCYTVPPGSSPVWAFRWPNRKGAGTSWNDQALRDVAVTDEGVYCAGSIYFGSPGIEAVVAKFPLTGPTGPDIGGALWVARPRFFPYGWITMFHGVMAVEEGGQTFLYATGHSQSDGSNNTAVLAKIDTTGKVLWTKVLGDPKSYQWSQGDSLVKMDSSIYVAGYVHYGAYSSQANRPHAGLWKVTPAGDLLWAKVSAEPIPQNASLPLTVVALGSHLYVACGHEKGPNGGSDALLLKYDTDGNLIWSKVWGSAKDDVAYGLTAVGKKLCVVGATEGWVGGGKDAFLLEVNAESGEILSVSYHGGTYDDRAYSAKVVGKDLYILGDSKSSTEGGNILGQSDLMLLRYTLTLAEPILNVRIDIKPGESPNPINLKSQGKIPVAILSTSDFDAPKVVDKKTVTFGRTGSEPCLAPSGCKPEDVNGDGLLDLVCHFETEKTGFKEGDTQGVLKGKTLQGRPFMGIDSVVIKFPKKEVDDKEKGKLIQPIKPPKAITPPKVEPPKSGRTAHKGKPAKTQAEALRQMQKEGGVAY